MYITIADLPAGPWSAQWWHRGAQTQLSASRAAADGQLERAPPAPAGKREGGCTRKRKYKGCEILSYNFRGFCESETLNSRYLGPMAMMQA